MNIIESLNKNFNKFVKFVPDRHRKCRICNERINMKEECIKLGDYPLGYNGPKEICFHIFCFKANIRCLELFEEEDNEQ